MPAKSPQNLEKMIALEAVWPTWVGKAVVKKSRNPFKSGEKIGTVKGITTNPFTNRMAFTFNEDDSFVECMKCHLVEQNPQN